MQISSTGLEFLKRWERFRSTAYNDGYGNMTIGYGHLIQPGEKFGTLSQAEALELLQRDVSWAESTVNQLVRVPLTQSQFDALVSLTFNWGAGNFRNSSHLALINSGDYAGTAARIREHPVTSGGVRSQGLVNRRSAEAALFLRDGIYPLESTLATTPATTPTEQPDTTATTITAAGVGLPLLLIGGLLAWALIDG